MRSNIRIGRRDATVSLYGRTDKLKRSGGTLGVEDDKFPAKTGPYLKRDAPYDNQLLQILAYLNSDYSHSSESEDWFDIKHESKEWTVNIRDKNNGNSLVKKFTGKCGVHEIAYLNQAVERFASLLLSAVEPNHHNAIAKCRVCQYRSMCPAKIEGA